MVKLPGAMTMPYPDLRHYTLRDYGNRVGIHRLLKVLDDCGVAPTLRSTPSLSSANPS